MELLSKELITSGHVFPEDVTVNPWRDLPEKILQFGEGNFLRSFVDWMLEQMNKQGLFNGKAVIVTPLGTGRVCSLMNAQDCIFTSILRGISDGQVMDKREIVSSVSRCLNSYTQFEEVLACASNPDLRFVISNTTEAGIVYSPDDKPTDMPPSSFPGKLTVFLYARYQAFAGDPSKGLVILPCELIEKNGEQLRQIVLRLAGEWHYEQGFIDWVSNACDFLNTLVDRIVTGYPRNEAETITEQLGYIDNVIDTAEPFSFWAIEGHDYSDELPLAQAGLDVVWTPDMTPYRTRKVRILNGAHAISVLPAYLMGYNIVRDFMDDPLVHKYLYKGMFEEIIPSLDLPQDDMIKYAKAVFERFQNPFLEHRLLDISLNSVPKFKARILPTLLSYVERHNTLPPVLCFSLAALIDFYRGEGEANRTLTGTRTVDGVTNTYHIHDDDYVLEFFEKLWRDNDPTWDAYAVVKGILAHRPFWDRDLNEIPGLTDLVTEYLIRILRDGPRAAMASIL